MNLTTASRHKYPAYSQVAAGTPSRFPSLHHPSPLIREQVERSDDLDEHPQPDTVPKLTRTYVPRKPLPAIVDSVGIGHTENADVMNHGEKEETQHQTGRRVYWVTPATAVWLFFIGLGAAIGHYVFFAEIDEKPVENQTWTVRYSLALAFIFKSALAASISIALAQHAWLMLGRSKGGTPVSSIDAMFLAEKSLLMFLSPSLWSSAFSTGLMAACIWLMPLTALVAPTALTVGTSVIRNTDDDCVVPTLDTGIIRNAPEITSLRALFVTEEGDILDHPSTSSERLTASVLTTGHQTGWPSPCGPNCTYSIQFTGPSWQCTQTSNVDDPRAPWKPEFQGSYWYWGDYGDGSNITVTAANQDSLLYSPVYYAGLNGSTNQFWAAFAAGFSSGYDISQSLLGESLRQILDVQAFYCQVANTSYCMRVDYTNNLQTNTLHNITPFATFDISPEGWNQQGSYSEAGVQAGVPLPLQDMVGLYTPMISTLSGYINRDPRFEFVANTSLGLVPSLIHILNLNVSYGSETPYVPRRDLGFWLEQLSHNLTVSLLSDPDLLVASTTKTQCEKRRTETVWKFHRWPLVGAYAAGLGVTLICLGVGAHALVENGVARDTAFSTVVRTTRDAGLDVLCGDVDEHEVGALPLEKEAKRRRLRYVSGGGGIDSSLTSRVEMGPEVRRRGFVVMS